MWKSAGLRVLSLVQLKYILSPILISVTQISVFGLSCDPTSGEACLLREKTQLVQYDLRISH